MNRPNTLFDEITPAIWLAGVSRIAAALIHKGGDDLPLITLADHKSFDRYSEDIAIKANSVMEDLVDGMPFGEEFNKWGTLVGNRFRYRNTISGETFESQLVSELVLKEFPDCTVTELKGYYHLNFLDREPDKLHEIFPSAELVPDAPGQDPGTVTFKVNESLVFEWVCRVNDWKPSEMT